MKVLHLEAGRHLYGGPRQVLWLMTGLRAEGVENLLVCPVGSAIGEAARSVGLAVAEVRMRGDADIALFWRVLALLRRECPDVLHVHSRRGADLFGPWAGARQGVPVVLSRRVVTREPRMVAKLKYPFVDRVIAISGAIRSTLLDTGVAPSRVRHVADGLPQTPLRERDRGWFQREFGAPADVPVLGVIAQLVPVKGHRHLIDALPVVRAAHPTTRVVFFGRGAREEALRARARRRGVADMVVFAGFRTDISRVLACLDLVVHPAVAEGLSVALLEAAAAGRAIVASRVGGIPEVVRDQETGLLVPPGDDRALATAIVALLDRPAQTRAMGARGAAYVADAFSLAGMVNGNLAVYRELCR